MRRLSVIWTFDRKAESRLAALPGALAAPPIHPHITLGNYLWEEEPLARYLKELAPRFSAFTVRLAEITLLAPETTLIEPGCAIGQDCVIEGQVRIVGGSRLGAGCRIASGAVLIGCTLGDNVTIGANSVLSQCTMAADSSAPPLTTIRGQDA